MATATMAIGTDRRALDGCGAASKLQLGAAQTDGLGAGGDVDLGVRVAAEDRELLRSALAGADLVFLVLGLGGGTGTGGVSVLLDVAREAGALTLCLATLPCEVEGPERRVQAERALEGMGNLADALILVPNDRLVAHVGEDRVARAFDRANEVLAAGIEGLWRMLAVPGVLSLDFSDLRRALPRGPVCTFAYGEGRGDGKAETAVEALLTGPLSEQGELLTKARSMLVSIAGGPDLTLQEIGDIMAAVRGKARKGGRICMGTSIDDAWQDRVSITVLMAEDEPVESDQAPAPTGERPPAPVGNVKSGARPMQTSLMLEPTGKGRFKDVEPTILDGEDLDIPTFVRRGVSIEK